MEIPDLLEIELFGNITANKFHDEFHALYSDMEDVLKTDKIKIKEEAKEMGSKKLEGLTFCFTGKLENMNRNDASHLVMTHGGTTKSGVTKDLSYLVTNSIERTGKFKKAQEQGTKIITEEEFLEMINE